MAKTEQELCGTLEKKNMGTHLFGVPVKKKSQSNMFDLKTNKINACNQIEFNQFY